MVFCFSKKRCDGLVDGVASLDLTSAEDKSEIQARPARRSCGLRPEAPHARQPPKLHRMTRRVTDSCLGLFRVLPTQHPPLTWQMLTSARACYPPGQRDSALCGFVSDQPRSVMIAGSCLARLQSCMAAHGRAACALCSCGSVGAGTRSGKGGAAPAGVLQQGAGKAAGRRPGAAADQAPAVAAAPGAGHPPCRCRHRLRLRAPCTQLCSRRFTQRPFPCALSAMPSPWPWRIELNALSAWPA